MSLKKIISKINILILCLALISANFAVVSASEEITSIIAFGDSIMNGYSYQCGKGLAQSIWSDYFGNRKFASLIAKEYGLTEINYLPSGETADKWYQNKAIPGAYIGNEEYWTTVKDSPNMIFETEIKGYDTEKLKNADAIIMNGGINNCTTAVGFEHYTTSGGTVKLAAESKAVSAMTSDEVTAFVDKYKNMTAEELETYKSSYTTRAGTNTWDFFADMEEEYLEKIVAYLNETGFSGKLYIMDNINPFSDGNTSLCYLWDSVIDYCITQPMKTVAEKYDNVEFVSLRETIRNGSLTIDKDMLHLTYKGNEEVYKKLSLAMNPSGENLLSFVDNTIPSDAEWTSIYDFENHQNGDSVDRISGGTVIDYNTFLNNFSSVTSSPSSETNLNCFGGSSITFDLSRFKNRIYGIRMSIYAPSDRAYVEINSTGNDRNMVRNMTYYTGTAWTYSTTSVGDWAMEKNPYYPSVNNKNIYSQILMSDFSNLDSITLSRMNSTSGNVYIDNVDVLISGNDLSVDVTTVSGASLRLGDKNGIRFYTTVNEDKIARLKTIGATVEIGTLIAPLDLVADELTHDSANYVDVKYNLDNGYYTDDTGFSGIVGSIVNIKESGNSFNSSSGNITRRFIGRGYVKVTLNDETYISYANNYLNSSRAISYLSYCLKFDYTETAHSLYSSYKTDVDRWAAFYESKVDPTGTDIFE